MAGEGDRVLMGTGEVVQGLDHGVGLTVIEVLPLVGIGFYASSCGEGACSRWVAKPPRFLTIR
jgi:hypothetical protein